MPARFVHVSHPVDALDVVHEVGVGAVLALRAALLVLLETVAELELLSVVPDVHAGALCSSSGEGEGRSLLVRARGSVVELKVNLGSEWN